MTSWNGLHKLPTLIFGETQNLFELRNEKCSDDGPLKKKTSEHIWQS